MGADIATLVHRRSPSLRNMRRVTWERRACADGSTCGRVLGCACTHVRFSTYTKPHRYSCVTKRALLGSLFSMLHDMQHPAFATGMHCVA